MKTKEQYINLLSNFQHKRGSFYGISKIGIFGSVARGEQKADSDVDVYYEGESMSLFKMGDLKEELENILECPVDVVRIRKSMNKLLKTRIIKDGFYV
ncbi:MAG: nucleotidyltransferase family protein [Prolixibacteraceae bacterium]